MRIHPLPILLALICASPLFAQDKSPKAGDIVYVIHDFSNLSVDGKNVTQLKWGTLFEIESVSRFDYQGVAKLKSGPIAGAVNRNDVKPIWNSQGLIRFTCPGMG